MRNSDPKTPALKKERIHGSEKNSKGSASDGKSKSVKFSAATENTLKEKVKAHNEKAPKGRKATLGMLKAVYRRGSGAFSTSHRPGMNRNQWAMGRVNAYLKLLKSGKPANSKYVSDNDLLPAAHPRSTKKSNSALVAAGHLVPEEQDLARALLEIVDKYGKFNEDETGVWAGYTPAEENEVASIGVNCSNCVFYLGGDKCQIISLPVEPMGKCRFAVIPDGVVSSDAILEYNRDNLEQDVDDIYYKQELSVELKDFSEYDSPETAIIALAEFSGLGYEIIPALRASWLRGVDSGEEPYSRARNLAEYTYNSNDADLLPQNEKGASS